MPDLQEFMESFVSIMRERIEECERHLQKITENSNDAESVSALRRMAHTMKGSASVMQFPKMAEYFAVLQTQCEAIQKGIPPSEEFFESARDALSATRQSLDAIAAGKGEIV